MGHDPLIEYVLQRQAESKAKFEVPAEKDFQAAIHAGWAEGLEERRRGHIAADMLGHAARAVREMGDLLREAHVFPEGLGSGCEYAGTINLGGLPLRFQFGSYRAQVVVVEDALSFQSLERDGEGSEVGVRSGHLRITLQVDAEFIAQAREGDQ